MTNSSAGVIRHPFDAGNHSQGPQSGDARLGAGGRLPFLRAVTVSEAREMIFFSGHTPPVIDATAPSDSPQAFGDTYTQTIGAFNELKKSLSGLGLTFGHLVKLQVFVVGDPAMGGRMDSAGFSQAYGEFFGTEEQPNLVVRTRIQVVALVNPGWLVEIEAVAVR